MNRKTVCGNFTVLLILAALTGCLSNSGDAGSTNEVAPPAPPPAPPTNQPPEISGRPPSTVQAGDTYSFTPSASDPDSDPISFSISGLPNWASFDEQTGRLQGTPGDADIGVTGNISISVSDGTAAAALPEFTVTINAATVLPPPDPNPAGYVGFGSVTKGADSCPNTPTEYHVTSLSGGSGQGTLRDAVSQDCTHVIFDVGGNISLGNLQISTSFLTIDGSTAPAPGITLTDVGRLALEGRSDQPVHDIIVNNIRAIGLEEGAEGNDLWEMDGSNGKPVYNIVFDHLTMQDAGDGNVDIYGDVHDITLSNSLIFENVQGHHFSQSTGRRERLTVYGNVYARLNERQPRVRHNTLQLDFVNNVIYGWGWIEGGAAGFHIDAGVGTPTANVENNIYIYVPGLHGDPDDALKIDDFAGSWHFQGNIWPTGESQGDSMSNSSRISMGGFEVERRPTNQIDVTQAGTHYPTPDEQALLVEISQHAQ